MPTIQKMMHTLFIIDQFRSLLGPLSPNEYECLASDMQQNGCREPLIVTKLANGEMTIVDGHNRYEICHDLQIPFTYRVKEFEQEDKIVLWILDRQSSRRNVSAERARYMRWKKIGLSCPGHGGDRTSESQTSMAELAESMACSVRTIRRQLVVVNQLDQLPSRPRNRLLSGGVRWTDGQLKKLVNSPKKKAARACSWLDNEECKSLSEALIEAEIVQKAVVSPAEEAIKRIGSFSRKIDDIPDDVLSEASHDKILKLVGQIKNLLGA